MRVYDRILGQVQEPVIIHWLGEMFDPALEGYWGSGDHWAGDGDLPRRDRGACRQGRRHQDLAAVEGEGDRHAPAAAGGRADVYRRRLQLRRADRRGRGGAFGRAARHLRRDRAGGFGGARRRWRAAGRTSSSTSSSRRCRCRGTSSRRRPGSTRRAWCSSPTSTGCRTISSWSAGRRARARSCIWPSCSGWRTGRGCCAIPELAAARMRGGARGAGRRLMTPVEGLSINLATVRAQWDMRQAVEGCLRHGITAIAPWRDQVAAIGLDARGAAGAGQRAAGDRALPRRVLSGARRPRSGRAAIDDNRRAVDEAAALGADCLVHGGRRAAGGVEGHRRGARDGARRAGGDAAARAGGRRAAGDRAAASDVCGGPGLREHARAGARPLRRARARDRGRRSTSITSGGTPSSRRSSRGPGRPGRSSRTTSATGWCRRATC